MLEELYRKHRRELVARLQSVFGQGPPAPEDLAQSAFLKLAALDDLETVKSPRAFLFRIAVNLGLDQVDRQARAGSFHENFKILIDPLQNRSTESVYLDNERLDRVRYLMDSLPDPDRDLLHRSRVKGETLAEIALDTTMSISTLSRRLARIVSDLRVRLEDDERTGKH